MRFPTLVAAALVTACVSMGQAVAITPEQATHVGGDLTVVGKQLAVLHESGAKIVAAAPGAFGELVAALGRIVNATGKRTAESHFALLVFAVGLLAALVYGVRRATRRYRLAFEADALRAKGAAGLLALDAADRVVVAAAAYLLIEFSFNAATQHDLLAVAFLWAGARWWIAMLLLEALLRPRLPALRLIAMSDAAAGDIKTIVAVAVLIGFTGISVMPVLLRAGMPIPVGQVIALVQGTLVAAGCALALWRYRASRSRCGAIAHRARRRRAPRASGSLPVRSRFPCFGSPGAFRCCCSNSPPTTR